MKKMNKEVKDGRLVAILVVILRKLTVMC
jgi:hypothetical protein